MDHIFGSLERYTYLLVATGMKVVMVTLYYSALSSPLRLYSFDVINLLARSAINTRAL